MTGASSIFAGDKLLTTPNPTFIDDMAMFELLGLKTRDALPTKKSRQIGIDLSRLTSTIIRVNCLYGCYPYLNIAFYSFRVWTSTVSLICNRLRFFQRNARDMNIQISR